jgi:hypothetical protein
MEDSIMWQRWLAPGQRRGKRARALRALLHLEQLEQRDLLTNSLVVVPSPAVNRGVLYGTAAIAHNDIWAVGFKNSLQNEQTLAEHFDGNSWQVVPTPAPGSSSRLFGVAAVASNDVWAVGDHRAPPSFGPALIEHWDGSSWTIIDSPTATSAPTTALYGVTATASNDVWAVGVDNHNGARVWHWDGSSWSAVFSSAFTGVGGLDSVSADAGNDVWAVEGRLSPGRAVLHFDGTSWARIDTHTQIFFNAITALSPTDVWAVGTVYEAFDDWGEPTDSRAAIAHWDGSQWQVVPSPDPRPSGHGLSELRGIAAISPTDIWAVGGPGTGGNTPLTEHWDGTSWSIIPSPTGSEGSAVVAVTALSDGTVAAVGFHLGGTQPLILQNPESAPASRSQVTGFPASVTAGVAGTVTVTIQDSSGHTVPSYTGTIHFTSSDSQAVLPADYTFTAADAGVHSFSVTLKTAGTQSITVTDTASSSITGAQTGIGVSPAAVDHQLFLQQPTNTAAGQTITPAVTVAVVDQYGNVVTSDNSDTVTLSIGTNPSGGTLSGTLTVTVVNGVATFSDLSIDLAGDGYNLHATIGGGLPDIDSSTFRIT